MVWANSILLGLGGLAIGVPILLHLLMQPKPKPLLFPALRFVQKNQRTNQRKMQLRHWILLALRILLLLILAAALAGPSTASNRFGAWVTTSLFGAMALIVAALLLISLFASHSKSRIVPAVLGVILAALLGFSGYSLVLSLQGNDGPVIGDAGIADGTVYVGTVMGTFYALDFETGKERWKVATELSQSALFGLRCSSTKPPSLTVAT